MSLALCVHRDDNVATLLQDTAPGPVALLGESPQASTFAAEAVALLTE